MTALTPPSRHPLRCSSCHSFDELRRASTPGSSQAFAVCALAAGLLAIALLDGARKVVHYALAKPTKEGLYSAMPSDAQFVAKPLLDTLIYRGGSLIGASYFAASMGWDISARLRRYFLLAVTVVWAFNSFYVGVYAERQQRHKTYRDLENVSGEQTPLDNDDAADAHLSSSSSPDSIEQAPVRKTRS